MAPLLAPDLDGQLFPSVVDEEFRSDLLADPTPFGRDLASFRLPEAVEAKNQDLLDMSLAGVDAVYMCQSTCSSGVELAPIDR